MAQNTYNGNGPKQPRKETHGGVWKSKDKNGATYLLVKVKNDDGTETTYFAFANKLKQPGEKTPDFILNRADDRPQAARPQIPSATTKPVVARPQPARQAVQAAPVVDDTF